MRLIPIPLVLMLVFACADDGSGDAVSPTTTPSSVVSTSSAVSSTTATPSTSSTSAASSSTSTTSTSTTSTTVATTSTIDAGIERATGSGTMTLDGEEYDVEVVACGWLSGLGGASEPLEAEPTSRDDFRLTAVADMGERALILDIDRDGRVGPVYVEVIGVVFGTQDDPGDFAWGNSRQSFTRVVVEGDHVFTPEPLRVLEDPTSLFSDPHEVQFDVTCDSFGGIPDQFTELVAAVLGIELPSFGLTGTVTIDDTTYEVTTTECSFPGSLEAIAESTEHDLVVAVTDLLLDDPGTLSDTIGIDIGDRSLVADQGVDLVVDGTVVRTTAPVPLFDLYTREPAGMVTVAIDCGS